MNVYSYICQYTDMCKFTTYHTGAKQYFSNFFFLSQILFQSDTGTERVGGSDSDNVRGSFSSSLHDQHPGRHSHFQPGRHFPYTGTSLRCSEGVSHKSTFWLYPTASLYSPVSLCVVNSFRCLSVWLPFSLSSALSDMKIANMHAAVW